MVTGFGFRVSGLGFRVQDFKASKAKGLDLKV